MKKPQDLGDSSHQSHSVGFFLGCTCYLAPSSCLPFHARGLRSTLGLPPAHLSATLSSSALNLLSPSPVLHGIVNLAIHVGQIAAECTSTVPIRDEEGCLGFFQPSPLHFTISTLSTHLPFPHSLILPCLRHSSLIPCSSVPVQKMLKLGMHLKGGSKAGCTPCELMSDLIGAQQARVQRQRHCAYEPSVCRKCIYEELSDRGFKSCPLCDIDLGCIPVNKLRPDYNLQNTRANIFPLKRRKTEVLEVSSSSKTKERSLSSLVSAPIISMQVAHTLPSVTDEVSNKGEILPIEWKKSSILKKRRLEDILGGPNKGADYHPSWNLRTEGGGLLLKMACRLVQGAVPHEISNELTTNPLSDICKWMKYHFANFLTSNRASISHQFEETGLPELKLVDKEAAYRRQCGELEQNLSNLKRDHNANLKQQVYFYESKLKEQAQQYEAKVKSLENEVIEKRKELFDQNKQLEQLREVVKRKDKSIEMLFQLTEDVGIRLKETLTSLDEARGHIRELEEQVKMIPKLQEESHRGGMEEGLKRVVRAVQAASPYVNWDQIHISESTPDEEREGLQRAFVEGIITAPSLATQDEDQGHIIIL